MFYSKIPVKSNKTYLRNKWTKESNSIRISMKTLSDSYLIHETEYTDICFEKLVETSIKNWDHYTTNKIRMSGFWRKADAKR